MKTWKQLATEALEVQDACNMMGLSRRFAEVVLEVRARLVADNRSGTDEVNRHPIVQLWCSKLHDLSGLGATEVEAFARAHDWVWYVAKEPLVESKS